MVEAPSQPLLRITSAALPVKAANRTLPSTTFGDVARQRGLAGAGIAEQAEDERVCRAAGLGLEPFGDGLQRGVLLRRKCRHGRRLLETAS